MHSRNDDDNAPKADFIRIDDDFIRVLHPDEHHRYLGRLLNLCPEKRISIEMGNRRK